jgi:hypothetical protein
MRRKELMKLYSVDIEVYPITGRIRRSQGTRESATG